MEKINFMFGPPGKPNVVSVSVDRYVISSIEKVDPQKYVFKGRTDGGYDFFASYSLANKQFSFNLVIQARGRVEVRQLGPKGREAASEDAGATGRRPLSVRPLDAA